MLGFIECENQEREIRALLKASNELSCNNLLLITLGEEGNENYFWFGVKGDVAIVPAWKWLLKS